MFNHVELDKVMVNESETETVSMIEKSGAYIGTFRKAYSSDSPNIDSRADFLNLEFVTEDGETAYISITTHNKDGSENFNMAKVHSLMTILKLSTLNGIRGHISDRWNTTVEGMIFQDLCGKRLGLLLQREEKRSKRGTTYWEINIVIAFDPLTRQTAREIIKNLQPKKLDELLLKVKDKTLDPTKEDYEKAYSPDKAKTQEKATGTFDGMDEDVPF